MCAKDKIKKRKAPSRLPGDETILKAFGGALHELRIEKGLSRAQADAVLQETLKQYLCQLLPRVLGIIVRRLRENKTYHACN